ncbi:hypothetical protein [Dyadobacter sp. 676]|uniref:C1q domain-containing protein n=1 Tax=Dyadobacter sp. 676 TaxID=3088362 RepID=A0AAU8FGD8_9BACT
MKTSAVFQKLLFSAVFGIVCSSSFAQVKIGSNPTVIEPNSNLEVEASTPSRKMKVDKTTGQVTIQDGTEGSGKVFTSDAVGGGSWQNITFPATSLAPFSTLMTTVFQTMPSSNGPATYTTVIFQGENSDAANAFNPASGEFTAPSSGYYIMFGSTQFDNTSLPGTPGFVASCLRLYKGTTPFAQGCSLNSVANAEPVLSASVSNVIHLNAGDVVTLKAAGTSTTGPSFGVVVSSFYGYKIAD